jgi:hypothetical protein
VEADLHRKTALQIPAHENNRKGGDLSVPSVAATRGLQPLKPKGLAHHLRNFSNMDENKLHSAEGR